jgi:hypothetical protein
MEKKKCDIRQCIAVEFTIPCVLLQIVFSMVWRFFAVTSVLKRITYGRSRFGTWESHSKNE